MGRFALSAGASLWLAACAVAQAETHDEALFEKGASLPDPAHFKREAIVRLTHAAVGMIRLAGYQCDTISAVDPPSLSDHAYTFVCNHFSYEYKFLDLGGHIEISIEGRVIATN